ncbi:Peroxisomal coenzyme A diphosphatase 1 like protein [Verticillium longisporum]|uniref:Peroxisomal coenzyme A diphosphatase 1 like protein n=1 Tax=Verticillium longisporum TaxID=100787 RepID=A0A8I2Z9V5_VERLO|nr:Peroxisomal coenzyme A diphosphatase 1 like protein [Verticillium longisporum]KAG7124467.1 Peroxisomal coenzyme A diphosphatase 1 like protein [Verticillium longisporum]
MSTKPLAASSDSSVLREAAIPPHDITTEPALPKPTEEDLSNFVTYLRKASASRPEADTGSNLDHDLDSSYWDAAAMSPLTAQSAAALARLRAYRPPPLPTWDRLPASRRAAVLLLLFADRRGDLRVVITMRAASLRNYSGHAAFPGGKADDVHETPYQIARREAFEEIGLPNIHHPLPAPFRIESLCELPCNIAQTQIVVRPCVAFLHTDQTTETRPPGAADAHADAPPPAEAMIPVLDAKEVAAVFSAPFHNFLRAQDEATGRIHPPGHWYDGRWVNFRESPWRVHNFYVPVDAQRVSKPEVPPAAAREQDEKQQEQAPADADADAQAKLAAKLEEEQVARYKVWGMTAHILVDAARLAYGETPEFEHNPHHGDEDIIKTVEKEGGFFDTKKPKPDVVSDPALKEETKAAAAAGAGEPAKM